MLPDFLDNQTLFQIAKNEQLYEKLIAQTQKDFTLANINIELFSDMKSVQLKTLIQEKIYYLILEKFPKYLNLLYIVDIPEKELKHIHMTDVVEVAEQVTFLVLRRELQKVWLKSKYS